MEIKINGVAEVVGDLVSLQALVEVKQLPGAQVVMELNGEIIPRAKWADTPIKAGDQIEILRFVGGG